jgi:subtilisin family serine protease
MNRSTVLNTLASTLCLAVSLGSSAAPQSVVSAEPEALARIPYKEHLIVRLLPGNPIDPIAQSLDAEVVASVPRHGLFLLALSEAVAPYAETLAFGIKGLPTVVYAEADEPTDPPEVGDCGPGGGTFGIQQCTIAFIDGAPLPSSYSGQYAAETLQLDLAHAAVTSSASLVIAVIDTGIDENHPFFAGKVLDGWDFFLGGPDGDDLPDGLDNDGDSLVDEGKGHGTHVAGLALLADPNAKILPLRALDSDGNGSAFLIAAAIYEAVDLGAHVINLSLSSRYDCDVIAEALMYAEYHSVQVVASAGNSGGAPLFPASYEVADYSHIDPTWLPAGYVLTGDNLISIAAVDVNEVVPQFSCHGAQVDFCTPGVDVYSAQMNGVYAWWSGTSMSAGLASGCVSFLLSIWPTGTSGTPGDLLADTAWNIDGISGNEAYAGGLGAGVIQLHDATQALLDP